MALRFVLALACLQVALANPLAGYYGGYPAGILGGYPAGIVGGYPAGVIGGYPAGIIGSPCAPPPCAPPPCAPPPCVKVIEQPVPQPVVQEIAVPVPQACPVTIPNPTFLDANTRITTVSGSNSGDVKSTTSSSWDPSGPLPAAHGAALAQSNPWAYTAAQYPTISPLHYGTTIFGPLA